MGYESERKKVKEQVDLVNSPLGQLLAILFLRDMSGDYLKGKKLGLIRRNNYADLHGDVLHLGPGTGKNDVPQFPRGIDSIVAIDIAPKEKYLERVEQHGIKSARLIEGDITHRAQLARFEGQFDHVVAAFLFCLIDNPEEVLHDVKQVLKPGGTLHLIEHGKNPLYPDLQAQASATWARRAHGCQLLREWDKIVEGAGYTLSQSTTHTDVDGVTEFQKPVYSIKAN